MAGKMGFLVLLFLCLWEVDAGPIEGFYLGGARSDMFDNKVITEIKFGGNESMICLQMKQGKLGPLGTIEGDTDGWTPCNTSNPVHPASNDSVMMDIDNIPERNDLVVTGVMLGLSHECPGDERLSLTLEYSPFDFKSGQLEHYRMPQSSPSCHTHEINTDHHYGLLDRITFDYLKGDPTLKSFLRVPNTLEQCCENVDEVVVFDPIFHHDLPIPLTARGLSYLIIPGNGFSSVRIQADDDEFMRLMDDDESATTDGCGRSKRSSSVIEEIYQNPHYVYIPVLVILALIIILFCFICRCLCNCCCPRPHQVVVNTMPVLSPEKDSFREV